MKTGVLTLNFGEPAEPTLETVVPYLERIFQANASLEDHGGAEEARARSRELAERRAPGLLAEYREIGGSPLNEQAARQAEALAEELRTRGHDARVYVGMQFTEPFIPEAVAAARRDGMDRIVGLPVYPLCGQSTTVAALREMADEVRGQGWHVPLHEVSGWHRHPGYLEIRADAVRRLLDSSGLDLDDPETRLVFSAHGTPRRYLESGNRYELYVEDYCRSVARTLGAEGWELGYQNHGNRRIPWTEPEIDDVVTSVEAARIVVDPVSFMHEQSETLAELDLDLREAAESRGLEFHRVPVPAEDPRFAVVLADLVEAVLPEGDTPPSGSDAPGLEMAECRCRPDPATRCLNAAALD